MEQMERREPEDTGKEVWHINFKVQYEENNKPRDRGNVEPTCTNIDSMHRWLCKDC